MSTDPRTLAVFGFKDQLAATEMLTALTRMTSEGTLILQDAVFVTKNEKGKVRVVETVDPSPGQAGMGGAFWGFLFGVLLFIPVIGMAIGAGTAALMAKLTDTGVTDDFIKKLRESIEPGQMYLAVLVSHVNREKALEEMKRFSGMAELISTNMAGEAVELVKEALNSGDVTHGLTAEESTIAE